MRGSMPALRKVQGALGLSLMLAACAPADPEVRGGGASPAPPPGSTAGAVTYRPPQATPTRATPIVAGRPARVFVFAGVDDTCRPLPAPQVALSTPPAKGDVTFQPGQETKLAASVGGTCLGAAATGTGVYYTARPGTSGSDRFSVTATLAGGESMTREFAVEIAE